MFGYAVYRLGKELLPLCDVFAKAEQAGAKIVVVSAAQADQKHRAAIVGGNEDVGAVLLNGFLGAAQSTVYVDTAEAEERVNLALSALTGAALRPRIVKNF